MITGTLFNTWRNGRQVGTDEYGNRYFEEKAPKAGARARRWVLYKGSLEASKIPPAWHAWMHYTTDAPVQAESRTWQKSHLPNVTGTEHSYLPPGHDLRGGERSKATGDYEPWQPV
ncbi:NADH:ubiquinone oxidoreductase subunit NDUFA12 [Insolitispirillum peregrinum]|uniref:NADH:ubiquinone oxidoreductase subunit NDUFA12 n=1 Tax=Insolitispirillum peregrinum TaxID=80876 RepID=UPI003610CA8C